ncbi:hypothetical protein [Bdellovibrio sp. HCB274]|uniref:hypothetical protein n=1 Tax=Bdellovibrio sp. HCB274 TaxID=3394361 RepID=UPI0039B3FCD4
MATRENKQASSSRENSRERDSSFQSGRKAGSERSERSDSQSRTDTKKGTSNMNSSRKSGSSMSEDDEDVF